MKVVPPPIAFKTSFRVSWVDTDAAQVMHFSNYFRFFEKAEEEFYRHLGFDFSYAEEMGLWFPRVEAFCQFIRPARFNDLLEVELSIEELKEKSVKYGFRIFNKENSNLLASGYVVIVVADKRTGKATQIPLEMVEKLKPFCK
ncbi:MAG: thioesterase family protein [Candidatus Bathyarchaeia archaeon]